MVSDSSLKTVSSLVCLDLLLSKQFLRDNTFKQLLTPILASSSSYIYFAGSKEIVPYEDPEFSFLICVKLAGLGAIATQCTLRDGCRIGDTTTIDSFARDSIGD